MRLIVEVPRRLTKEQKKLIDDLRKSMPVDTIAARKIGEQSDKPFFEKVKDLFG